MLSLSRKVVSSKLLRDIFKGKYPVVRQYDQIDCGPAALLSVLRFWGGDSNLVHVRDLAKTDAQGTNMVGLVNAAKNLGFDAVGATGEYEDLMKENMPCIAHAIKDNHLQHYVAVYEIDNDGVLIGDPGEGIRRLSREEFLKIWKKKAVVLLTPKGELFKEKSPHWLRWVFTYFKKEESWLYQTIFLGIIYTLLGLLVAVFVQWLIDRFIPGRDYFNIVITGVLLLVLQLLRALAGYLRQRFLVELNKRVSINVNKEFLRHIFHLPLRFFHTRKKGDITARINDGVKIQQALLRIFGVTVIDGFIMIGSFAFIFILASTLGWIVLATLPLYALLLGFATRTFKDKQRAVMKSYAQLESFYFDSLAGIDDILSYNASSVFAKANTSVYTHFQDKTAKLGLTQAKVSLYAELAAGMLVMTLLSYGAILVIQESLMLGQMMAAYSLLGYMLPAVNRLVDANIALQGASVAVQRLRDLLLVEKEKNSGQFSFKMEKSLNLKEVAFAWPKGDVLYRGLNLSIPKGRITSLWGVSGSGKSTLVKIIQRKYVVSSGETCLDSTPIENFDLISYRQNIGVVPQEVKIFNGTILENILIGRQARDVTQVLHRISELGLTDFLARFEHELFTLIGEEGRQLSSGEMQMLGLIRAAYEEPEILIVDEGISAIDVEIEHLIFKILRNYSEKHAIFIITHNLLTIMKTDYVYLLEDGLITAAGMPSQLLKSHKRFRRLWNLQTGAHLQAKETKEAADVL